MVAVIAFDVNETLLDLSALDDIFDEIFGSSAVRTQWFTQMLQLSFVGGLTGRYVDFTTAQIAALRMLSERMGQSLTSDETTQVIERMKHLPPHPEVPSALRTLSDSDLAVVALTNSPEGVAEAQLINAGIRELFDAIISADSVHRLKPAPEPYHAVANRYDVIPGEVRLIAAHSWDISGALAAGCKAAFVMRSGAVLSPIGGRPDIIEPDIRAVVDRLMAVDIIQQDHNVAD